MRKTEKDCENHYSGGKKSISQLQSRWCELEKDRQSEGRNTYLAFVLWLELLFTFPFGRKELLTFVTSSIYYTLRHVFWILHSKCLTDFFLSFFCLWEKIFSVNYLCTISIYRLQTCKNQWRTRVLESLPFF